MRKVQFQSAPTLYCEKILLNFVFQYFSFDNVHILSRCPILKNMHFGAMFKRPPSPPLKGGVGQALCGGDQPTEKSKNAGLPQNRGVKLLQSTVKSKIFARWPQDWIPVGCESWIRDRTSRHFDGIKLIIRFCDSNRSLGRVNPY